MIVRFVDLAMLFMIGMGAGSLLTHALWFRYLKRRDAAVDQFQYGLDNPPKANDALRDLMRK
jgi:uncharacterized protein (DUF1778 family)